MVTPPDAVQHKPDDHDIILGQLTQRRQAPIDADASVSIPPLPL